MVEYVQVYPEESVSTVAETITVESRKEAVVKETVVQKEDRGQQKVSQPVRERDDDWFLLLDVVPRETSYVPPGTHSHQMSHIFTHITPKKTISQMYAVSHKLQYSKVISADKCEVILFFWLKLEYKFCLLSVSLAVPSQIHPSVQPQRIEVISIEQKLEHVDLKPIRLQDQHLSEIRTGKIALSSEREGGDDWFALFDIIREKPVFIPPGTFHCQSVCIHC